MYLSAYVEMFADLLNSLHSLVFLFLFCVIYNDIANHSWAITNIYQDWKY